MNPYTELNLEKGCSLQEINEAYKKLSKRYHPDVPNGDQDIFIKIKLCVDILRDPHRRKMFDDHGLIIDSSINEFDEIINNRFSEMCISWIESQLSTDIELNLTEYFDSIINGNEKLIKNALMDTFKSIDKLKKSIKRVKCKDKENIVVKIMEQKLKDLYLNEERIKKDKFILGVLKDKCSKYSSIEEVQANISFGKNSIFDSIYTTGEVPMNFKFHKFRGQ